MKYNCSLCDYSSDNKHCVIKHINRKIKCKEEGDGNVIEVNDEIKCEFCNKNITTKPNLTKHLKICKVKKVNIEKELKIKNEENIKLKQILIGRTIQQEKLTEYKDNYLYMYILQEREFIKLNQQVYKIGKTRILHNRMGDYPKGSKILCVMPVHGDPELTCINIFRENYIPRTDIGSEYFEGAIHSMLKTFINLCVLHFVKSEYIDNINIIE